MLGLWCKAAVLGKALDDLQGRKKVLAVQADSRVGALVASPPDDAEGTTELYKLLETVGFRERSESIVREEAGQALTALRDLPIDIHGSAMFEDLVVSRVA